MIGETPTMRAAITAERPTPPTPNTARLEPAGGASALSTVPVPVWIPQPSGAASSNGMSRGSTTTLRAETTATLEKLDCPKKCEWTASPCDEIPVLPSPREAMKLCAKNAWQW